MFRKPYAPLFLVVIALASCRSGEERAAAEQVERQAQLRTARADSVQMAEAAYDPTVFDTITWESSDARFERGRVVWMFSCRKCHGQEGLGDGETAIEHELAMPEILAVDWKYAGNIPDIRHRVYVGHETEMPSWGLYGLKYRDVDAVADYIERGLRGGG